MAYSQSFCLEFCCCCAKYGHCRVRDGDLPVGAEPERKGRRKGQRGSSSAMQGERTHWYRFRGASPCFLASFALSTMRSNSLARSIKLYR